MLKDQGLNHAIHFLGAMTLTTSLIKKAFTCQIACSMTNILNHLHHLLFIKLLQQSILQSITVAYATMSPKPQQSLNPFHAISGHTPPEAKMASRDFKQVTGAL